MMMKVTAEQLRGAIRLGGAIISSGRGLEHCQYEIDLSSVLGNNLTIGVPDKLPINEDQEVFVPGLMTAADDLTIRHRLRLGLLYPYMSITTGYYLRSGENPLFVVGDPSNPIMTELMVMIGWNNLNETPEITGIESSFGELYQAIDYWRVLSKDTEFCGIDVWILPRFPWLDSACQVIARDIQQQTELGDRIRNDYLANKEAYREEYSKLFKELIEEKGRYLYHQHTLDFQEEGLMIDQGKNSELYLPYTPWKYQQLRQQLDDALLDFGVRMANQIS